MRAQPPAWRMKMRKFVVRIVRFVENKQIEIFRETVEAETRGQALDKSGADDRAHNNERVTVDVVA